MQIRARGPHCLPLGVVLEVSEHELSCILPHVHIGSGMCDYTLQAPSVGSEVLPAEFLFCFGRSHGYARCNDH